MTSTSLQSVEHLYLLVTKWHLLHEGTWFSGVDYEFERMLEGIFDAEFMAQFKLKRPAAYVELLLSFEARKRSASPHRDSSLNIFPPFAFIDYYRKFKGKEVCGNLFVLLLIILVSVYECVVLVIC
jgi:hypothetical protein